jgi:uncharacterized membrane protein YsdA (DUF1294 family)
MRLTPRLQSDLLGWPSGSSILLLPSRSLKGLPFWGLGLPISTSLAFGLLRILFGLSVFIVAVTPFIIGFGVGFGLLKERPQIQVPDTGNFLANLLLLIAITFQNVLSALFNNAVGVILNSFPLMHLISLLTPFLGLAAMYVDKQMAQFGRWMLRSERAIEWYALTGGGPGILAGAFIFRHKTRHGALLAKVAVATVLTWLILLSAIRL